MSRRWFSPLTEAQVLLMRLVGPTGADRARWAAATSLQDLGELTAAWLSGEIATQPGYCGPVDVDEDDAPGLTATLIALNRAGFVTRSSQSGYDGGGWAQLAAVDGYADTATAELLRERLAGTGYEILTHPARARFARRAPGIDVSFERGRPTTGFGTQQSAHEIAVGLAGAGRRAITAACQGLQVTIWDPICGRNEMWAALRSAAQPPPGTVATDGPGPAFRAVLQAAAEHDPVDGVHGRVLGLLARPHTGWGSYSLVLSTEDGLSANDGGDR